MLNNRGSALISIIFLAIILNAVFMVVYMTVTANQKKSGGKRIQTVVFVIAEAGKEHALSLFRSGSITPEAGTVKSILSNVSFGGGQYTVKCRTNAHADTIFLESLASYGMARCSIEVTCSVNGCQLPTDSAYNYGIVSGGEIDWSGSGDCNAGSARIHCNDRFTMSGSSNFTCQTLSSSMAMRMKGSGDINGDVKTPSLDKSGSGKISGTTTLNTVAQVDIPQIDLTPYYDYALKNGQVFSETTISGSTNITIPGGIMWVNGNFKYSGSGNITGSIIATGDIKISGSGDFTAVKNYPALVSRDGNIDMSGSGKVKGLIYAKVGEVDKSGSGDVIGSIICGANLDKSGSWNTLVYHKSVPIPPDCEVPKYVEIGWREL